MKPHIITATLLVLALALSACGKNTSKADGYAASVAATQAAPDATSGYSCPAPAILAQHGLAGFDKLPVNVSWWTRDPKQLPAGATFYISFLGDEASDKAVRAYFSANAWKADPAPASNIYNAVKDQWRLQCIYSNGSGAITIRKQ